MKSFTCSIALLSLLWMACPAGAATIADRALEQIKAAPPISPDSFDFVVCGDSRSGEPVVLPKEFYTMISEWNVLKPALVVNVGDLILGGPVPELDAMWTEFEKAVAGCEVPFFPVAGNHDVNPDPAVIKIYEDRIGPLIYSFSYGNSLFVILNSEEAREADGLPAGQVEQLIGLLRKSSAKNVFLFYHTPFFQENWDRDWSKTAAAIKGFPVRAVFAGHEHMYRDCGVRDGVHYVVTGGAGAERSVPEEEGGFLHYLLVRVRGDKVTWSVIRPGSVFPEDVVTQVRVETARGLQDRLRCETIDLPWGEKLDRTVAISFQNPFQDSVKSTFAWTVPVGWRVEPPQADYTAAAGATASLPFHVWADTVETTRFPAPTVSTKVQPPNVKGLVELREPLAWVPTLVAPRAAEPIKVDGDLTEWSKAVPTPLTYAVGYDIKDKDDLSANVRCMWDEAHLYVALEVTDNEFNQPFSGDIVWSADSVEFWIEKANGSFSLTAQGPQVFIDETPTRHPEKVMDTIPLAVKRDGVHVTYEAAFPTQEMPQVVLKSGGGFLFSILVNDLDPAGPLKPRHYVELTPGAGAHFVCPMVKAILAE